MTGLRMINRCPTFHQDTAASQDSAKAEPARAVLGVLERMSCTLPDTQAREPWSTDN